MKVLLLLNKFDLSKTSYVKYQLPQNRNEDFLNLRFSKLKPKIELQQTTDRIGSDRIDV